MVLSPSPPTGRLLVIDLSTRMRPGQARWESDLPRPAPTWVRYLVRLRPGRGSSGHFGFPGISLKSGKVLTMVVNKMVAKWNIVE